MIRERGTQVVNTRVEKLHMASLCFILVLILPAVAAAGDDIDKGSNSVLTARSRYSDAEKFSQLVDRFFDFRFRSSPDSATVRGVHEYDALAPDMSEQAMKAEINELKLFEKKFAALKSEMLPARSQIDLQLIGSQIKAHLLELEEIRSWERNPDIYSSLTSQMIYDLVSRDFAPLPQRLKYVIAREEKIGAILQAGKNNLKNPPRIYTEIALEQLPGIIDLFQNSLVEKFKPVNDQDLLARFQTTNEQVIVALKDYQKFLKEDLLPRSRGSFALGARLYAKKLLYDEMEDTPLAELLARGEAELKKLQHEFIKTAKEIDPSRSAADVLTTIASDHTTPDKLLSSMQGVLNRLRDCCLEKNLITIPSRDTLQVVETPPFMRALTFAAMDAPGPFEPKAREAYYYVTLPEPDWKPERVEEHMRAFSKYDLINTSVHEAFPGHFVQGLWERQAPSKTAMVLECDSYLEGWAHYCEQMMVDEGLDNGDKNLKLAMLHDALLRCCRYIVGIKLHTGGMTVEEGMNFFVKEGYQEKANAEREVKRGTAEPTYLVYTLGKLQLMALREDYKKLKGKQYSLKDFHDQVMAQGSPPIKIIRQVLMGAGK
jgi:uncharacterized protein (DUF885 family)